MDFFIPLTTDHQQAENVYSGLMTYLKTPPQAQRIHTLSWMHEGIPCECSVGGNLPDIFCLSEPILAIFDCGDLLKICTPSRGTVHNAPIYVDKLSVHHVEYFNPSSRFKIQ